jgi:hypothetical protein
MALNGRMINELLIWNDLEGSGGGLVEILFGHCSGGIEGSHEQPIGIADIPTDIRTEHCPNASLEH